MKQQDYQDVMESTDRDAFERRLVGFAEKMGFPLINAALAIERPGKPAKFVAIGNTPAGFIEASRSMENTQRDPVHRRLKASHTPITYDRNTYISEGAEDLWSNQARFGYRTGIAVALHLAQGKHVLLGLDRDEPLPRDDGKLTVMMAEVQLLAVYAQETAIRLLDNDAVPATPVERLSSREREVLQWTREGKSANVVAQIMSLSTDTVNFHLRNACIKLGVSGKHMAVLKAISLGLL